MGGGGIAYAPPEEGAGLNVDRDGLPVRGAYVREVDHSGVAHRWWPVWWRWQLGARHRLRSMLRHRGRALHVQEAGRKEDAAREMVGYDHRL